MNKEQYLRQLEKNLKGLSKEDKEDAVRFYEDYIEESGLGESESIEEDLGDPKETARKILGECVEKQIEKQAGNANIKNNTKTIWLILLGILASPLAFPLLIVLVTLYFCMAVVVISMGFSALACGVAGIASGLLIFVSVIWAGSVGQGMVMIGTGLIAIALGALACIGLYKVSGLLVKLLVSIHHKIFQNHVGKKVL